MAAIEESRGLEWSHIYLYDDGAEEELPAGFDPTAGLVFSTESTLVVRGVPEYEGDVRVRITFDEGSDSTRTPFTAAAGQFLAPSGEIIARTSSWDEPMHVAVPPSRYAFTVKVDDRSWPRDVIIDFKRVS